MGRLVWLASYPKSGSTWLQAFLRNYIREPATPYDINALLDLSAGESAASLYRQYDPGRRRGTRSRTCGVCARGSTATSRGCTPTMSS